MNIHKNHQLKLIFDRLQNIPNAFCTGLKAAIETDRRVCKNADLLCGTDSIKDESSRDFLDKPEAVNAQALNFSNKVVPVMLNNSVTSSVRLAAIKSTDSSSQISPGRLATNPALQQAHKVRENKAIVGEKTPSGIGVSEPKPEVVPRKRRLSDISQARLDAYVASTEKLQKENTG